ncbi:MAG: NADH:flavin oxidoreductase/NADH oxidase [Alphaproteobacteria bacterium]|jgi:2,4-dienoyl-CoA reductase-like NADH-dependent reductase (Old Yellow Enzyme family)|nr:NADH:flavin oxidoreductase/NADH oxidase [Rhodospirillaceae bacterium]MBT6512770.1 NADH:flavin oxidoreductase/NADH oxidase [Rhodospirillaceae bacterium]MBT7612945.1 NADH:flavin oxidoreductase/NADH oxidase [Rhodospirillaceae bacterium]MDG2479306.1 NADH:flavin oxidoreductase/NADH oxidase [Alphaproteobacteria bacterium]
MNTPDANPLLFQPFTQRGLTAKNRIVVAPMCQYESVDGAPTDWHLIHMGRLAMGGAGIVFVEETAVEARGRKTYQCAGLWKSDQIPAYRRVTEAIRQFDGIPAVQLGHSGRKGSCHSAMQGWTPLTPENTAPDQPPWTALAPSPLPDTPAHLLPHEMDRDDIATVIAAFVESARLSGEAGFDLIEIHGAHGYLIHQFLSPLTNQRSDGYGGDRDGRMRFALEIAEAVRDAWPENLPLWWRASCVDGKGGVWDIDDTVVLARELKARGVDLVDCSSGGIQGDTDMPIVPRTPGYQVGYAETIRNQAGIATAAVGEITEPDHAETILAQGKADVIAMARELMLDANWPARAARELGIEAWWEVLPPSYAHRLEQRERVRDLYAERSHDKLSDEQRTFIDSI